MPDLYNYDPMESLTINDIADLKSWGFNLVRLTIPWEAIDVEAINHFDKEFRTNYNYKFLEEVDKLIQILANDGIYTLIVGQNDILARSICGHGIPNFYANHIIENA